MYPHSHGRLKSFASNSGKGLPKMDTGIVSCTQIAVTASKAGSRLWHLKYDLDCFRDFFSCLSRNSRNCCSRLILWSSHLGQAKVNSDVQFIHSCCRHLPFHLLLLFLMFVVALQVSGIVSWFFLWLFCAGCVGDTFEMIFVLLPVWNLNYVLHSGRGVYSPLEIVHK